MKRGLARYGPIFLATLLLTACGGRGAVAAGGGAEIPEEILGELDEETLITIDKFFENNLNVSETSRQLFIHRNTLVYRLDKLQKATGLDLRAFEDAITFKIALMVVKYMDHIEKNNY